MFFFSFFFPLLFVLTHYKKKVNISKKKIFYFPRGLSTCTNTSVLDFLSLVFFPFAGTPVGDCEMRPFDLPRPPPIG